MTQNSDKFEVLKFNELSISEMQNRAQSFLARMSTRRTVRNFSDRSVPKEIIDHVGQCTGAMVFETVQKLINTKTHSWTRNRVLGSCRNFSVQMYGPDADNLTPFVKLEMPR